MAEQILPPEIVAYLQAQEEGRVETANDALKQLTDRERHVLREAAVMGWVRGAMAAGGGREAIPKDIAILVEVINCCRSNSDLYPKIAAAANGDLEPDWADLREMARGAGWSGRRDPDEPRVRIWGVYRKGRKYVDASRGWARSWKDPNGQQRIDMAGPEPLPRRTASLVDPSPAEILAAARLVGLVGAS